MSTLNLDPDVRYYALHKPPGVVTTMRDPQGRPDIRGFLPAEGPGCSRSGRLDRDSEGLLLLTNDGDLANRLMHPSYGVEKEYLAEVEGAPTARAARPGCARGSTSRTVRPARSRARVVAASRRPRGGALVMTEGRKREVRRLLAAVGLPVTRLVRLRVGPITLDGMSPGEVRALDRDEVQALDRGGLVRAVACGPASSAGGAGEGEHEVRAVRGAIRVDARTPPRACSTRPSDSVRTVLERNGAAGEDLVSMLFTVTDDIALGLPRRGGAPHGAGFVPADVRPGDPRRGVDAVGGPGAGALPHRARSLGEVEHVYLDGAEIAA